MPLQNAQAEFIDFLLSTEDRFDLLECSQNVGIYRRTFINSLLTTLQNIYPLIERLVGNDFFHIAAKEYINQYPSRSSNLNDYGRYFSDFLAHYPPVKSLIYLSEIAEFEWICHNLQFASDCTPLDVSLLARLMSEEKDHLHFILHPASQVAKFHYPILHIIELCKAEQPEAIDLHQEGINLLIIRRELDVILSPLNLADFTFLNALQEGASFIQALEATLIVDAEFKLDEKLTQWISDKTIVDFKKSI